MSARVVSSAVGGIGFVDIGRLGRVFTLLAFLGIVSAARAQVGSGTLHGQITDPSGAAVTNATVQVLTPDGQARSANTDRTGTFEVKGLAPGKYIVKVDAPGFATFLQEQVEIAAGQTRELKIALTIEVEKEHVDVQEQSMGVDTSPTSNTSAIVLTGKDLDALPDDPDELLTDLQALAGPSAGPNGGQIYIDGFTAGQLPPKSSIREIRINQNPFSAEFDKLGYGRIEIFTKPGTDKFHGQASVLGNSSAFNSKNPFVTEEPSYYSTQFMANLAGPISKKASFFVDFQRRNIDEVAIINAIVLNPTLENQVPFNEAVPNPRTRTNVGARIDYQINKNNTLTGRYQFYRDTLNNGGVGGFSLPEQGYNSTSDEHTVQISDTQILSTRAVNETRFQYLRENSEQDPLSTAPALVVPGAFTSGGSAAGKSVDHTEHYELQNYTSLSLGKHVVKFGGRLRVVHDVNQSSSGFNGAFTWPTLDAYQSTQLALQAGASTAPGATQYSLTTTPNPGAGVPTFDVTVVDAGLYVQDDWRVRSNLTLSYGLRFETQNAMDDHADWAPRLSFAWGIDGGAKTAAKTVLRAGFGMFYERYPEDPVLQTERYNGINLLNDVAYNPNYPIVSTTTPTSPTIYQTDPRLHAPYVIQTALSLERQVTKSANVTLSYINSHGVHQFVSRNVNAPVPPATDPLDPNVRPFGNLDNIYQYSSEGTFNQNQLIANFNVRVGAKLSLFGNYTLNYAHSNTSGLNSFPYNQYDLDANYGRASFDTRQRLFVGGTVSLPYAFRISPFLIATSGAPYNITAGQDLNGDSILNDRPWFANSIGSTADCTNQAAFVLAAGAGPVVPINDCTGTTHFTLNLRLSKTFGFGKEGGASAGQGSGPEGGPRGGLGGGPDRGGGGGVGGFGRGMGGGGMGLGSATSRRYNLTFSVNARNVLNRVNLASPIGNLGSPLFGESNALAGGPFSTGAANRRIELQASFSF